MTSTQAYNAVVNTPAPDISATKSKVDDELSTIDQAAIKKEKKDALEWEEWDGSSPINGVPASEMLARQDVPETGSIYLIKDVTTGKVIYFQPHKPGAEGVQKISPDDLPTVAADHLDKVAEHMADREAIKILADRLS